MINTSNLEEAKKLIKKEISLKIVLAQNDEFNRKILEYGGFQILLSPEIGNRKDKIRALDSGLNHILATIAKKKDIAIGINLDEIKNENPKEKAKRLSKIIQNIKICRKSNTRIAVKGNSIQEVKDFLNSLGASTTQVKETIVF